jgi:hypothetical protein
MNNEPFIIKILSGPYQDNFLELELNKKLTLGGNLDADIIITPDENTPIFAEMIITQENVTFNYFSQAARDHAGELLIPQVSYELPFIFTLKNIQLVLGKPQNIDFMLSKLNQPESPPDDPLLSNENEDDENQNSISHSTLTRELQDKINKLLPTKKHKIASITIGILVLSLIVILLGFAITSHSSEVSYQTTVQDQQNIKKLFFALPSTYSGLSIDTNPSGKIEIYGVVPNQKQILYIKTYFVNYKNEVTFELITNYCSSRTKPAYRGV